MSVLLLYVIRVGPGATESLNHESESERYPQDESEGGLVHTCTCTQTALSENGNDDTNGGLVHYDSVTATIAQSEGSDHSQDNTDGRGLVLPCACSDTQDSREPNNSTQLVHHNILKLSSSSHLADGTPL